MILLLYLLHAQLPLELNSSGQCTPPSHPQVFIPCLLSPQMCKVENLTLLPVTMPRERVLVSLLSRWEHTYLPRYLR